MTTLKTQKFSVELNGGPDIKRGMRLTMTGFGLASLDKIANGTWEVKRVWRGKRNMTVSMIKK